MKTKSKIPFKLYRKVIKKKPDGCLFAKNLVIIF